MPKNISWKKFIQNFRKLGFEGPFSGGRHSFMKKGTFKVHVPNKHEGDISVGLVNEILRQAGISKKIWDELGN